MFMFMNYLGDIAAGCAGGTMVQLHNAALCSCTGSS